MSAFDASFLVLTEDSATDAVFTVVALIKKMLVHIQPETKTNRLEFRPLDPNDAGILALQGNHWKSDKQHVHRAKVALVRAIAAKLREAKGFALFHYDGDVSWANRESSENVAKFRAFRVLIEQLLRSPSSRRDTTPLSDEDIQRSLRKLVEIVPYWCIESWVYQATELGSRFCQERNCGTHCDAFDSWRADRSQLDEITRPKEVVCFGSSHNGALAAQVPVGDVCDVGKSLAAAAHLLLQCEQLVTVLEATRHAPH